MTVLSGGGDLVDVDRFETLKLLFEIVREDGWVSAKAIARKFPDGKSAANSDLYRFQGVLFMKRGFAPPEWSVVTDDAFEQWGAAIELPSDGKINNGLIEKEPRRLFEGVEKGWPRLDRKAIPDVPVCSSCERPVKANGTCGCG